MPHFIDDQTYARLVDALAGTSDPDEIKIALGEIGDLWPLGVAVANLSEGLDRSGDPIGVC